MAGRGSIPWVPLGIFGMVGVFIIAMVIFFFAGPHINVQDHSNCKVTGKESVSLGSDQGHEYRVYSSCGTFKVADQMGRWSSADLYGSIQQGETYNITSNGYRIPLTSVFPNVKNMEKVS